MSTFHKAILIQPATLMLPTSKGTQIIDPVNIVRISAIGNYSKLFFNNGSTLVVAKLLKWFEEKFHAGSFVRIHRSHLVNKQYLQYLHVNKESKIVLLNGESFTVSKRKRKMVKHALGAVA